MPDSVTAIENIWIPLADGRRLAARLWLPDGAAAQPVPAVIEYMPYRKRDQTRSRDEPIHGWLSQHGYACLRVDMHGSGDSDGILRQEFQAQEQDDALEMIAWVAARDWCSGSVAMLGKSWGGFSAMQAAMRHPPALKAIVSVCAGDNRYDQSLHFTGGALLNEQLWWSDAMMLFNLRPPDPAISGPGWLDQWRARLDAAEPWIGEWLTHQRRDRFWQENSVSDDYSAIRCPVFAVGGWADYISRSVPRLVAGLTVPRRGLVGPWGHHYPHDGIPGPAIGFLQECRRFLDAHMNAGAPPDDEPLLRAWMPEWRDPGPNHKTQVGRWVAEQAWPSPRIRLRRFVLNERTLDVDAGPERPLQHCSPQTVGLTAPEWLSQDSPGEVALDQRIDDAQSLTFDSAPLTERLEILGSTVLELELAVDQPLALIAVRLNDVAPDGRSLRVALGVLNLTHRDSDSAPTALEPGRRMRVRVTLPETAHAFAAGHRIRVALSTSYWPIIWPSPKPVTVTVFSGASALLLPERPVDPADAALRPFDPPEAAPSVPITVLEPTVVTRTLTRDLLTGTHVLTVQGDGGFLGPGRRYRLEPTGTVLGHRITRRSEIRDDDPLSARIRIAQTAELERDDWQVRLETSTEFHATATEFHVAAEARAYLRGELMHERQWRFAAPRDLV